MYGSGVLCLPLTETGDSVQNFNQRGAMCANDENWLKGCDTGLLQIICALQIQLKSKHASHATLASEYAQPQLSALGELVLGVCVAIHGCVEGGTLWPFLCMAY
jgi:hypothetical protein